MALCKSLSKTMEGYVACTSGRPIAKRSRALLWLAILFVHAAYLALGGGLSAHYGAVPLAIFTLLSEATAFFCKVIHGSPVVLSIFAFDHSI